MDLQKQVKAQVRKAFSKIGTLASVVVLKNRDVGFNFNTMATTTTVGETKQTKAIRINSRKRPSKMEAASVTATTLMFIAEDVDALNAYDLVEFEGKTWSISHPASSNGYTATVEISREL